MCEIKLDATSSSAILYYTKIKCDNSSFCTTEDVFYDNTMEEFKLQVKKDGSLQALFSLIPQKQTARRL